LDDLEFWHLSDDVECRLVEDVRHDVHPSLGSRVRKRSRSVPQNQLKTVGKIGKLVGRHDTTTLGGGHASQSSRHS
jgi:hypothetical protein